VRRRSNLLVLLGVASFVLGLVAVYLITADDDAGGGGSANRVPVLVAEGDLSAGALGEDVITAEGVRVIEVDAERRAPDALTSPSQLSGARLTSTFVDGEQIRSAGVQSLGGARAEIPEGLEAVALDIGFVAGGANTIIPGDRVNVFLNGTFTTVATGAANPVAGTASGVQLLLTNVLVLDVQQGTPSLTISQSSDGAAGTNPGSLTVVVAVDTVDAEKVIFGSATPGSALYLSRVRIDGDGNPAPPAGPTEGRTLTNILAEAAVAAFSRSNG
jgi:Flp pilus assembly protein CpaB